MNTKHQKEFTELVEPHLPSLYSTAKRMTQDQYDAEDLVQETLFKAYRALDKYKKNTNFRAWIFRILINTYITHYRKTINQPQKVSFDDLEEFYLYKRLDEALFTYNTTKEDFLENLFEDEIKDALEDRPTMDTILENSSVRPPVPASIPMAHVLFSSSNAIVNSLRVPIPPPINIQESALLTSTTFRPFRPIPVYKITSLSVGYW